MVREVYPRLKKMLERFREWKDGEGIIHPPLKYWNFFDWSFELNGMEFNGKPTSLMNFLYIIAARAMLSLAREIGAEPVEDNAEIERILKNTVKTFYSEADGVFLNTTGDPASAPELLIRLGVPPEKNFKIEKSSRLVHALALLAGADKQLCAGMTDENLLTPELYYGVFLLDGYEISRDAFSALRFIRQHWGKMLDSGTPTLWENGVHKIGKAGFGGSASLCHGFSTSPAAYLQDSILGVAPLAPGFRRFRFAPDTGDLTFAEGTVPTPHGAIRARWELAGETISAELEVPENCTAETPAGSFGPGKHAIRWGR